MAKIAKKEKEKAKPEKPEKLPTRRRVIGYLVYLSCLAIVAFAFLAQMGFLGVGGEEINNPNFQTTQNTPAGNLPNNQQEEYYGSLNKEGEKFTTQTTQNNQVGNLNSQQPSSVMPETDAELLAPAPIQTEKLPKEQSLGEMENGNLSQNITPQQAELSTSEQPVGETPNLSQNIIPQQPQSVEEEQSAGETPNSSLNIPQEQADNGNPAPELSDTQNSIAAPSLMQEENSER